MKRGIFTFLLVLGLVLTTMLAYAGWVNGYFRKDGTYVRGHYRSNPDGIRWNNYGRSRNSYELYSPYSRDADKDGIPNMFDIDDNNNGIIDDYDRGSIGRNNTLNWFDIYNNNIFNNYKRNKLYR